MDTHKIIEELKMMPLKGTITIPSKYIKQILEYIEELEKLSGSPNNS